MFPGGLYLVLSPLAALSPEDLCGRGLAAGARVFQLRMKDLPRRQVFETAKRLREMTRRSGAWLVVNDHADIALAVEADGVHLGQDDLPIHEARKVVGDRCLIGVSTHSTRQAMDAQEGGADYVGFGPVFPTDTKDAGSPRGVAMLADVARAVSIPVVAIGGISRVNVEEVMAGGAYSAAAFSEIARSADVKEAVQEMMAILNRVRGG